VIRTLIVDDEPLARARLRRLLSAEPDVEIAGECVDGAEAIQTLTSAATAFDLVVLDIEMPVRDGFEVAALLDSGPAFIFVTAHEEYALRAFDADAVDYLLKPVDPERIAESIARVRRRIQLDSVERIPARVGRRIRFVDLHEIDWIEAQGNYAALHVAGRVELIRETMTSLEQRLDQTRFTRIHRRIIVRNNRIRDLTPHATGEYTVRLHGGTSLVSGRTYRARLAALARGAWSTNRPKE
jgi:two-component system LytT family response regulator